MRVKNLDLLLVTLSATLNLLSTIFPAIPSLIKMIPALPLVFFIPGYLLSEILFQRRKPATSYRLAFCLACSLAITIPGGFLLNAFPAGLRVATWSIFFAIIASACSLWILYMRYKRPGKTQVITRLRLELHDVLFLLCTLILVVVSLTYVTVNTQQQPTTTYTQLWMIPARQPNQQWQMKLGMENEEITSSHYQLTLSVNGTVTKVWPIVTLAPHHIWQQQVSLKLPESSNTYVQLRLYRSEQPHNVYREVHTTLKNNVATGKTQK